MTAEAKSTPVVEVRREDLQFDSELQRLRDTYGYYDDRITERMKLLGARKAVARCGGRDPRIAGNTVEKDGCMEFVVGYTDPTAARDCPACAQRAVKVRLFLDAADVPKLDEFTRAYIVAALWSGPEADDEQRGVNDCGIEDLAPEALQQAINDCRKFQEDNAELLEKATCLRGGRGYSKMSMAGHDFALTRAGTGAGFWDGDWSDPEGDLLTEATKKYPELDWYVGDDGKVYT